MAIHYSKTTMGTFTLVQKRDEEVKKYKIQLRKSNCLACFLYIYKQEHPEDPEYPYVHQLIQFLVDEKHLKNCMKEWGDFQSLFTGKMTDIKLNLYHNECKTLLKYMLKSGLQVKVYYKEDV